MGRLGLLSGLQQAIGLHRALGLRDDEIRWLAGVNHAIRCVVTAADNLIDDEDKPVLPLVLPAGAVRFRNTLGLLARLTPSPFLR